MDNLAHQGPKDCQGRMDRVHQEGIMGIQVIPDPEEGQQGMDNQELLGNQEDKDYQVSPGLKAHQVIQVLVFKVTLDVWDHLAHQAHMDLEGSLGPRVWMDWMVLEDQRESEEEVV